MDRYDFRRLTDFDFEKIAKDILETSLGIRFEIFATGADQGIDLRHSRAAGGTIIVQCKHWIESGRSALLRHMRTAELHKISMLAPARYILATSVDLTVKAKDALITDLSPYVLGPGDLLGIGELEAALNSHPEIARRHIRLWLSSTQVLNSLLNREILLRSEQLASDIRETIRSFAPTTAVDQARYVLNQHNVCIIAGVPGVGKTTLAQVLAAEYVADGYELYELSGDVSEGLKVWSEDVPQLFYYDDFLGQTTLRDITSSNEDARLVGFIKRVSRSDKKRFILTTREYILSQAKQRSERLDDPNVDVSKFILDVSVLDARTRAEILYNHIYFSRLPQANRAAFAKRKNYMPLITHPNFNPRLVAMSFDALRIPEESPKQSVARVRRNLDEPMSLWRHMFDFQLDESEIALVEIVFLHDGPVPLGDLESKWMEYSRGGQMVRSPTQFRRALGALEGTLLRIESSEFSADPPRVGLHNPSVRDFMRVRLTRSPGILQGLIARLTDLGQLAYLWNVSGGHGGSPLRDELRKSPRVLEEAGTRLAGASIAYDFEAVWALAGGALIDMSAELGSAALHKAASTWLGHDWPDYFPDPWEAVALVHTLRASGDSAWRDYADELDNRIVEDVTAANLWSFDDLNWAREILSSLDGPAAKRALETVESSQLEKAVEAIDDFHEGDSFPSLGDAEQVVSILSSVFQPDEVAPGFSEFAARLEEERDAAKGSGRVAALHERVSNELLEGDVHDVMSMLLK